MKLKQDRLERINTLLMSGISKARIARLEGISRKRLYTILAEQRTRATKSGKK